VNLFELDPFTLPSGRVTHFKIECDVLHSQDWDSLARLAVEILPPFGSVEGVPRGGILFADSLRPYVTEGPLLIADDVWVTGLSMERHRAEREGCYGIVAFTRGTLLPWVRTLFQMTPAAEEATYSLDRPVDWWKERLS
jgi:hypothetical protein